jgi:hypothetical protein
MLHATFKFGMHFSIFCLILCILLFHTTCMCSKLTKTTQCLLWLLDEHPSVPYWLYKHGGYEHRMGLDQH